MTLCVCIKGKDGMVLASDSRGTFGDPRAVTAQNDNMRKLYLVSKYVGDILAGSGELGAMVMNEISEKIRSSKIEGVTPIMGEIRKVLIQRYQEWFAGYQIMPVPGNPNPVRPTLVVLIAGYDIDSAGKPTIQKIYSLNCHFNFAPMLHDYGFAIEGVAQYALYLLNRLYTPESNVDKLLPLAAYVISETASQDGKVGGPIQTVKITSDGGGVTLSPEDINNIVSSNTDRSKKLRSMFFGE